MVDIGGAWRDLWGGRTACSKHSHRRETLKLSESVRSSYFVRRHRLEWIAYLENRDDEVCKVQE